MPRLLVVGAASAACLVAGCQPELQVSTVEEPTEPEVSLTVSPAAPEVNLDTPVVVTATNGLIKTVEVLGPGGEVSGAVDDSGTQWSADASSLEFGSTYTIKAEGFDSRGRVVSEVQTFTTVEPEKFFSAVAEPGPGDVVGVGIPITVRFSKKVTNKADVERAMVVRTAKPIAGAWAWKDSRTAEFRPKRLWPGDMDVQLDLNLQGVEAKKGVFGREDTSQVFRIRPSVVSVVDASTFSMDVFKSGELVKTIPVTTGKVGWETRSGTKVLLTKERVRIMDAASGGMSEDNPEYYRVTAPYAMRITYSGEFVHGAPWSTGYQGWANVSHGCVGMSEANAAWWWNENEIGDVVIIKNTGREQGNDGNGLTVWNDPWHEWLSRSETGGFFTDPLDSTATVS